MKKIIIIIITVLILATGSFFVYRQVKSHRPSELQTILKHISTVIKLPDETPTLAIISDLDKLKSQKFFDSAQNGDRVLMYEKSGLAILYRPSLKQIINISTLSVSEPPVLINTPKQ